MSSTDILKFGVFKTVSISALAFIISTIAFMNAMVEIINAKAEMETVLNTPNLRMSVEDIKNKY